MINQALRHKPAMLLLFSILLLWVQIASTTHAANHPFHPHDEQCEAFLLFDQSPSLPGHFILFTITLVVALCLAASQLQPLMRTLRQRSIRAPPACLPTH